MKNIYEIFDEFELAKTKKEKQDVFWKNYSPTLAEVLRLAFHPDIDWLVKEMPEEYKVPDTLPGISHAKLSTELRRLYLFQKGNITAERLTEQRQKELLLQLLESIEPREAEVIIGIFNKDLGVKGLTLKFVQEIFPNLLK
jgi:DNA-directed RNA polymerase sigma subunit (sigma70/sigma32)